jgi:hypothetical protein
MGLFNKKEKKIIAEISKKTLVYHTDIEKEIQDLLEELKADFEENKLIIDEFSLFVSKIKLQLSHEDQEQLQHYFEQVTKMKRCAIKGIESMKQLSREQHKLSREVMREYDDFAISK